MSAEIYVERANINLSIAGINAERTYLHHSSHLITEKNVEMYNEIVCRSNINRSSADRNIEITNIIRSRAEKNQKERI